MAVNLITGHPRRARHICCFLLAAVYVREAMGQQQSTLPASESLGEMPPAHTISGDCSFRLTLLPRFSQQSCKSNQRDTKVQNNRSVKTATWERGSASAVLALGCSSLLPSAPPSTPGCEIHTEPGASANTKRPTHLAFLFAFYPPRYP